VPIPLIATNCSGTTLKVVALSQESVVALLRNDWSRWFGIRILLKGRLQMKEKEGSDVLSASLSRNIERISIPASLSFSLYLGGGTIPKLLIKGKAMFPFYLN